MVNLISYEASHYAVFSSLLPLPPYYVQISPQNTVLKHPHLSSSLNVRDQVSHLHITTDKIMVLYIFIRKFLEKRRKTKD